MDIVELEAHDEAIKAAEERAVYTLAGCMRELILELPSDSKLGLVFLHRAERLELWAKAHIARVATTDGELERLERALRESGGKVPPSTARLDGLWEFLCTLEPSPRHKLRRALNQGGITTLAEAASRSDEELVAIDGVGWTTVTKLRLFMTARAEGR